MAIIPGGKQRVDLSFINPQQQRQKKLTYLLAAVILAIAGVYFFYVKKPSLAPNPIVEIISPGGEPNEKIVELLKTINLDINLLKDNKFRALVLPGIFPIVPGEKGRPDPFAPF